jgi:hypothetical protein
MIMLASAAQKNDSAASALWHVRIPPSAIEVITSIQAHRRTSGAWPKQEEISLPEDITELLLKATGEDLEVVLKKEDVVAARFTILKDGTLVAAPLLEDLMSVFQSEPSRRPPVVPIAIPPKQ